MRNARLDESQVRIKIARKNINNLRHADYTIPMAERGFLGDSDGKASACNARDQSSIPRLGRSPGEGNDNPLQYPCLENPMDGGA